MNALRAGNGTARVKLQSVQCSVFFSSVSDSIKLAASAIQNPASSGQRMG